MSHQDVPGRHKSPLRASELPIVQEPAVESEVRNLLKHLEDRLEGEGKEETWERVPLVFARGGDICHMVKAL